MHRYREATTTASLSPTESLNLVPQWNLLRLRPPQPWGESENLSAPGLCSLPLLVIDTGTDSSKHISTTCFHPDLMLRVV